jgi:hypothetical protein
MERGREGELAERRERSGRVVKWRRATPRRVRRVRARVSQRRGAPGQLNQMLGRAGLGGSWRVMRTKSGVVRRPVVAKSSAGRRRGMAQ